jgi:hypothetical protein
MSSSIQSWLFFVIAAVGGLSACTWETDLPDEARAIRIDAGRELLVTNDAVLTGPLGMNSSSGTLSFRYATERLALRSAGTARWLDAWSRRLVEEGHPDRARAFERDVTCRWLHARRENGCDEACNQCATRDLPLALAPFRLVAVVNRTDLSVLPDRAGDGGEGRLVFALTNGPADDARSAPLPLTVIFEYAQIGTARSWAERWHSLGSSAPNEAFSTRLAKLTTSFVGAGTIAQIRTADAFTGPAMILHEFSRSTARDLVASNVRNTPDWSRVEASSMKTYAHDQSDAIAAGTAVMPKAWWASSSSTEESPPDWVADLPQYELVMKQTCAGCHAQSERGFQIDPLAKDEAKLSRFLVDPTAAEDELRRRIEWMQWTLTR